jgi:hypothetical protein
MIGTLAVSQALIGMAQSCAATAAQLCSDAVRLRTQAGAIRRPQAAAPEAGRRRVMSFSLDGVVEGRPVHAEWRDNRLVADPLLLERGELLVDIDEEFLVGELGPRTASLTGPPIVTLLTLMRACDRVRAIDVVAPPGGTRPRSSSCPR